jgi:hypothetical protein
MCVYQFRHLGKRVILKGSLCIVKESSAQQRHNHDSRSDSHVA